MHYKFIVDSDRENRLQSNIKKLLAEVFYLAYIFNVGISTEYGGLASLSIDEEIDATLPAYFQLRSFPSNSAK
eukprot:scaffold2314_cov126-Skeletonema_dohrnii-CCMP3373.AAC.6